MDNDIEIEIELCGVKYISAEGCGCKKCAFVKKPDLCEKIGSMCIPINGPYLIFVEKHP